MKAKYKVAFLTIVPSPYQRDLFGALAKRPELDLTVYYMEAAAPDSPWPEVPLRSFEQIIPGRWLSVRGARIHVNWSLPDLTHEDLVVINSFSSFTAQRLMRRDLRGKRWLFWGEIFGSSRQAGATRRKANCSRRFSKRLGSSAWGHKPRPTTDAVFQPYRISVFLTTVTSRPSLIHVERGGAAQSHSCFAVR